MVDLLEYGVTQSSLNDWKTLNKYFDEILQEFLQMLPGKLIKIVNDSSLLQEILKADF